MRRHAWQVALGHEQEDKGQVGRIDEEAFAGVRAEAIEQLRAGPGHVCCDTVENGLQEGERQRCQQQGWRTLTQESHRR